MPNITIPVGLASFFSGRGKQAPPDPGNMSNPPGNAGIQAGNYQFIQPEMIDRFGNADMPDVPPAYRDWGEYPVNVADLSGTFGGGVYSGEVTNPPSEAILFFDPSTGLYFDIGDGFGS